MIVVTTETIPGKRIVKVLGLAKGNSIRARHVGHDFMAVLKNLIGGEITQYTKVMAETREQSLDRMMESAELMGANAIVALKITTTSIMNHAAEFLAVGTAVLVEEE
jgi:uncharacterized protein YbjQ (UPF0145 family)